MRRKSAHSIRAPRNLSSLEAGYRCAVDLPRHDSTLPCKPGRVHTGPQAAGIQVPFAGLRPGPNCGRFGSRAALAAQCIDGSTGGRHRFSRTATRAGYERRYYEHEARVLAHEARRRRGDHAVRGWRRRRNHHHRKRVRWSALGGDRYLHPRALHQGDGRQDRQYHPAQPCRSSRPWSSPARWSTRCWSWTRLSI